MLRVSAILKNQRYPIKRDANGLYIDADGIRLRRFKGPAHSPDPFTEGVGAFVRDSNMGPEYRLVKLTAAYEPWKVVSIKRGPK